MSTNVVRGVRVTDDSLEIPARVLVPTPARDPEHPAALLERARADAAALVAQAQADADEIRREAHAEGWRAGAEMARAEVAQTLAALNEMGEILRRRREELVEEATAAATELAVQIAAKLVRAELSLAPQRVVDVMRGAVRRASDRRRLSVLVHPDDLAICRSAAADIMERMGGIGEFEVVDEPRVDRGSCIVRTLAGDVDATFSGQLGRVIEALSAPPDQDLLGGGA